MIHFKGKLPGDIVCYDNDEGELVSLLIKKDKGGWCGDEENDCYFEKDGLCKKIGQRTDKPPCGWVSEDNSTFFVEAEKECDEAGHVVDFNGLKIGDIIEVEDKKDGKVTLLVSEDSLSTCENLYGINCYYYRGSRCKEIKEVTGKSPCALTGNGDGICFIKEWDHMQDKSISH